MNFKSQISTTHEQSQRLIDLGLNPATADMILSPDNHPMCTPYSQEMPGAYKERCIPAWSLSRLLDIMPYSIEQSGRPNADLSIDTDSQYWFVTYEELGYDAKHQTMKHSLFDAIVDMIEWLIWNGYFNEEYLKHSNSSNTGKEEKQ